MIKGISVCMFLLLLYKSLYSIENYPAGARAGGLSGASVTLSDVWSAFHNQAGLARLNSVSGGIFYESRFMVEELQTVSGTLAIPVKSGCFGFSFLQFGKNSFRENKFGVAFSKSLTTGLSAGIQLDYLTRILPEDLTYRGFATFEGGIDYNIGSSLVIGAHIFNPIRNGIDYDSGKDKMPAIFRAGIHYYFNDLVLLIVEIQDSKGASALVKSGVEFSPVRNLFLRFGASGKPLSYSAGIGYKTGRISTDISFSYHGVLGLTPAVSIQFGK